MRRSKLIACLQLAVALITASHIFAAPLKVLGGSPTLVAIAAFGGYIYLKRSTTLYRMDTNIWSCIVDIVVSIICCASARARFDAAVPSHSATVDPDPTPSVVIVKGRITGEIDP